MRRIIIIIAVAAGLAAGTAGAAHASTGAGIRYNAAASTASPDGIRYNA